MNICPTCGTTSDTCHRRRPCREVRWRDGHGDPITRRKGRMFAAGLEIERVTLRVDP